MQKENFDNFDEFAHDYRAIHNQNLKLAGAESEYFSEFKVKWIHDFLGYQKPARILDLGAGDGTCLSFFSRYFSDAELFGIDVSEKSIEEAKAKGIGRAELTVYNGKDIPYQDGCFDVILVATVLHHIRFDLHKALMQEARRVLKPGGKLFIVEHNPYNPVTRHMVNTCPFDADANLLSPGYAKSLLQEAGFGEVENRFILFFPRGGIFKRVHFLEPYLAFLPIGGQYVTVGLKS